MGGKLNIQFTDLAIIPVTDGDVYKILSCNDIDFEGFGEVYISQIEVGRIKAWKRHTRMTMNLVVPIGTVEFIFTKDGSDYQNKIIGENNYQRITVAPNIWFGFQNLGKETAQIINVASIPHDDFEVERVKKDHFNFTWGIQ